MKLKTRIQGLFSDMKAYPKAVGRAVASVFVMGLGQLLNKQWMKAIIFFCIPLIFLGVELASSSWGKYIVLRSGKASPLANSLSVSGSGDTSAHTQSGGEQAGSLSDLLADDESGDASSEDLYGDASSEDLYGDSSSGDASSEDLYGDAGSGDAASEDLYGDAGSGDAASDDLYGDAASDDLYGDSSGSGGENYFTQKYEYPNYALNENGKAYPIRDFGGFFTKGVWGVITLGTVVKGDNEDQVYSGRSVEIYNKVIPWISADSSANLLGIGLIAIAFLFLFIIFWIIGIMDAFEAAKRELLGLPQESMREYLARIWENLYVYIMMAPGLILILFFTAIPVVFSFLMAFTNYSYRIKMGMSLIKWVGFDTFKFLATDPGWLVIFGQIFLWTALWAILSSFTVYTLGFFNALIVESPLVKAKKLWRTIMVLPWAIPGLVSLMVFRNVFHTDGLMNQLLFATNLMEPVSKFLHAVGLQGKMDMPIYWLSQTYNGNLAKAVVLMVNLWLGYPYHMMLIIGVLSTIPRELYEAAHIDGATGLQRFRYITLPTVLTATIPSLIMTFSYNFNNFGAVYFVTGGGPGWDPASIPDSMRTMGGGAVPGQTDILLSWIYKMTVSRGAEQFSIASVYSILIFIIIGTFSVVNMARNKSFKNEAGE